MCVLQSCTLRGFLPGGVTRARLSAAVAVAAALERREAVEIKKDESFDM